MVDTAPEDVELDLDELGRRLKKLGVGSCSRRSLMRIRAATGEAILRKRPEDGKIVGRLTAVVDYLSQNAAAAAPKPGEAATPKPPRAGGEAPILDFSAIDEADPVDLEDPAAEVKSATRVLRRLEKVMLAFDLQRLEGGSLKTFLNFAEGYSRTLARVSKARDDLLATRIKAEQLLEEAAVERSFVELAELHVKLYDQLPDRVVAVTMKALVDQGIPPTFNSDLLKDHLHRMVLEHRAELADAVDKAGAGE